MRTWFDLASHLGKGVAEAQRVIDRWELTHWIAYFELLEEDRMQHEFCGHDRLPPLGNPKQASVEKMQNALVRTFGFIGNR